MLDVFLQHRQTFLRLTLALFLGALVGVERQWRQRAAGLRTNTLVCFGAAAFVDLASSIAGPHVTGVIAYVVSGVGFLGAGAIIKDGASIRGLNTAATLWCSAAVGACAGAGQLVEAGYVTLLLVLINLCFRPISRFIDNRAAKIDSAVIYSLSARCPRSYEVAVRALCLKTIAERPLLLRQLRTQTDEKNDSEISIYLEVESPARDSAMLEDVVRTLRQDPEVESVVLSEGGTESE